MSTTQKPFDINAPIEHIQTRSGEKVLGIVNHGLGNKPIAALLAGNQLATFYTSDGCYFANKNLSVYDLVVVEPDEIIKKYTNIYKSGNPGLTFNYLADALEAHTPATKLGTLEIITNVTKNTVTTIFHPA